MNIINMRRSVLVVCRRSYKNFGHKRQPIPAVTTLWHGFLTFTFLGMCLDWKKIGSWVGIEPSKNKKDWDWDTDEVS